MGFALGVKPNPFMEVYGCAEHLTKYKLHVCVNTQGPLQTIVVVIIVVIDRCDGICILFSIIIELYQ